MYWGNSHTHISFAEINHTSRACYILGVAAKGQRSKMSWMKIESGPPVGAFCGKKLRTSHPGRLCYRNIRTRLEKKKEDLWR